ncbi:MAG: XdhC/CoxI family protein [Thermoanaerobaculia bacterium]|nr:XdhC/CoxI family protein [Thermoanaerobaculia bacterium]
MTVDPHLTALSGAESAVRRDGRAVLCQIVRAEGSTPGKLGWKMLVLSDGSFRGNLGGGAFEAMVQVDARGKLEDLEATSEVKRYYLTEDAVRGEATGMVCGGMLEVLLEVLSSPPVLVVVGGGPVGQALAQAGQLAGFDIVLVEDRAEFRSPELFPPATEFVTISRGAEEDFLAAWSRRELLIAIVSRCWETDSAALASVLRQKPSHLGYLGVMGSRRKVARIREEISRRGESLDKIVLHAPIGMPGLGDTPGQIAIAIVAEILTHRNRSVTY